MKKSLENDIGDRTFDDKFYIVSNCGRLAY